MEVLGVSRLRPSNGMSAGVVVVWDGSRVLNGRVYVQPCGGVFVEGGTLEERRLLIEDEAWWSQMLSAVRAALGLAPS